MRAFFLAALRVLGVGYPTGANTAASPVRHDAEIDFLRPDGTVIASIQAEIAETEKARARGLMGRSPAAGEGMLFIHPRPERLTFWMRNTPASLDIVFVGADGIVVDVAERLAPFSDRLYRSKSLAQFAVEVPGGFTARHRIGRGDRVRWRRH